MALKATIFKVDLQIADMDRHYYQEHALTIARHPSETDERMMVRVLAFARHASEALVFSKGLWDVDEPDIWEKDLTGAINLWVEVGQPDEKRILKACGRAGQVVVYCYSSTSHIWWAQISNKVARARNLTVINLPAGTSIALSKQAQRNMQLQCTIQDGQIWMNANDETVQVDLTTLQG
ncbi:YaeQ family protein [Glaciimonas sp. CA11.2]|uniref:YaeQ family protein n=1 Tax=unclassified Glaciimonas TaxID=2644401 RepID=UPI002AB4BADA|nr:MULTISPECIES: YaeQ family protein [unclassified Glaciimonas]MDY7546778.1 YaeQ family protein [Glaciimonas sp. CA11.2]MEB0011879.1 YaeQ family protein [Glaciimonas sp. Cout2]MEB0080565.1 YaeQ family protein [Glaciimonas sp. Gout2]MEB0164676.1 YaeQ family protein [Glaciimonas sp. CA11.2]